MLKTKMIYVDLDDVLCETARGCLAIIEREFGKRVAYECLTHFDLGVSCALGPEETDALYRIVHHPDELLGLEPITEATSVLHQWIAAGFEVAVVTGRPPASYEASVEWLERHRVPYHRFVMVDKYGRFPTENTAAITLSELASYEFCWAVEDSQPMADYLANQMQVPVALYDRPWNWAAAKHPIITRHRHWREIATTFANDLLLKQEQYGMPSATQNKR